jgi:hypothetical protein
MTSKTVVKSAAKVKLEGDQIIERAILGGDILEHGLLQVDKNIGMCRRKHYI